MKSFRTLLRRLTGLFSRDRSASEITAELESHLELHIADNLRAGMTPQEARRAALVKLGGVSAAREAYSDQSTLPVLENVALDVRFALRQLRQKPAFAVTAIVVLSLGICAASAIFAFVDAALIRPLPYKDPARLVAVDESSVMFPRNNVSYFDYLDWKKLNKSFTSLDVYTGAGYLLKTADHVEPVNAARVSDGFFQTLGIVPVLGRTFRKGEDLPSAPQNVLLSYPFWQKRFGGTRNVIGQSLLMSGERFTIIGVLPADFQFAPRGEAEVWTPLHPVRGCETRRSCHNLDGIARLKPGVSVAAALAEMKLIASELERQYPDSNRGQGASVEPLADIVIGPVRSVLLTLMSGAALLFIIALVNVVSLLLVRSESRRQEIAVRRSLGASRGRIVVQFLIEGLLLIGIAAAVGMGCAQVAGQLLLKLIPADMMTRAPYLQGIGFNLHVLVFISAVTCLSAAVFAISPLLPLPKGEPHADLGKGGRWSAGISWRRLGSKLVVVEFATALVLLISAGLLAKSFYRLLHVEVGFEPSHLAAVTVAASDADYGKDEQAIALARNVVANIGAIPGVSGVGLTSTLPVSCNCNTNWIRVVGKPFDGRHEDVLERDVSADYFRALHVKLLRGRFFTEADDKSKKSVVIVNRAFVRKYLPGEDPIGRQIGDLKLTPKSLRQIIGVIDDIHEGSLDEQVWPAEYDPFNQSPDTYFQVIVRTNQDEHAILPQLRSAIRRTDPGLGISDETSMSDRITKSPAAYLHRSSTWLVGSFAVLALILSVVGLYGVVTYSVTQRTREIGVRIALGAETSAVYALVLKEAGWLIGSGIVGGVLASLAISKAIQQLLFGVPPWDPATLASVSFLLATAALLASFVPAERAAHVDPLHVLRAE
jgi:predicted permease